MSSRVANKCRRPYCQVNSYGASEFCKSCFKDFKKRWLKKANSIGLVCQCGCGQCLDVKWGSRSIGKLPTRLSHHNSRNPWHFSGLNKELAYIMGVYIGDGFRDSNGVGLSAADFDFVQKFADCLNKEFNTNVNIGDVIYDNPKHSDQKRTSYSSKVFFDWLKQQCGVTPNKHVPKDIWSWPNNLRIEFLLGLLDSEITVSKIKKSNNGVTLKFDSSLWNHSNFVHMMFDELGVSNRLRLSKRKNDCDLWVVRITTIDFIDAKLTDKLASKSKRSIINSIDVESARKYSRYH